MALHRLTALALSGALALGVTACGHDSPPQTAPRTTPATASPSPTGPATEPAAPVLPDLAARKDAVGAKAFTRFYFAALTYAMKTGDTGLMDQYAAEDCETCAGIATKIRRIYDAGGRNDGGGWPISRMQYMNDSTDALHHMIVSVTQPPQRLIDETGKVRQRDPRTEFLFNVWASQGTTGWRLREIRTAGHE